MNILLINHYAGSLQHGMEYRPFYMSQEWVRLGHQVTIVAGSYSHVRSRAPDIDGDITEEVIEGVRYLWFKVPPYRSNGLRRVVNIFSFVGQLIIHAKLLADRCANGAVIASSTYPLDAFPAYRIAKRAKAMSVFEVHDLWPLSPIELGGMSPFNPFIVLLQKAESFAYRNADKVVSLLPNAEPHMQKHGLAAGKFVYIPNGVNSSEWLADRGAIPEEHRAAFDDAQRKNHFTMLYAGAHGVANGLDSLLEAARLLAERPIALLFVGQGEKKQSLMRKAVELRLANVLFLPPVKKEAMPALLGAADFLIICLQRCSLFRFGISPNKLIDYMMAGKPVIQAIAAGNDIVTETGCGFTVAPESPEAIADAAVRMMNLTEDERRAMGGRGKAYVLANHEYATLSKRFLEVLTPRHSQASKHLRHRPCLDSELASD